MKALERQEMFSREEILTIIDGHIDAIQKDDAQNPAWQHEVAALMALRASISQVTVGSR